MSRCTNERGNPALVEVGPPRVDYFACDFSSLNRFASRRVFSRWFGIGRERLRGIVASQRVARGRIRASKILPILGESASNKRNGNSCCGSSGASELVTGQFTHRHPPRYRRSSNTGLMSRLCIVVGRRRPTAGEIVPGPRSNAKGEVVVVLPRRFRRQFVDRKTMRGTRMLSWVWITLVRRVPMFAW